MHATDASTPSTTCARPAAPAPLHAAAQPALRAQLRAGALAAALLLAAGMTASVYAQKTYRCGNAYQSFPCALSDDKGGPVKTIDSSSAQKPGTENGKGGVASTHPGAIVPTAGAAAAPAPPTEAEKKLAAAKVAEAAEEKKKTAALADKKAKCDKINNDINYNTAQSRSGGSQTTMDRLNAERGKLNDDLRQAAC